MADAYALLGSNPTTAITRQEAMAKARAAALKALTIDDTLAEAHTSLAFIYYHYDWNWPAAEREFQRAFQLNPNYPTAHHWYAYYLTSQGRMDRALEEIRRAQEMDPLSLIINTDIAEMLCYAGQYDRSIEQAKKVLEMDPEFALARRAFVWSYWAKHQYAEAEEEAKKGLGISGANTDMEASLAITYAIIGQKAQARELLLKFKLESERLHTAGLSIAIAQLYASLGEKDQAFAWLEKDFQTRDGGLTLIKAAPYFDSLHSDPRFADLVRRIGLP